MDSILRELGLWGRHSVARSVFAAAIVSVLVACDAAAAEPDIPNVEFARIESRPLLLDIYQPGDRSTASPLVVWVHGGAWRAGTRQKVPVTELTKHGFAIASVD